MSGQIRQLWQENGSWDASKSGTSLNRLLLLSMGKFEQDFFVKMSFSWICYSKFKSWKDSNAGLSWSWLFALMKSMNLLPLCPSRPFPQSSLFDSNWLELRNGIIVPLFLACPQLWSFIVIHNNKNLCTYILTTSTLKLVDSLLNKSQEIVS